LSGVNTPGIFLFFYFTFISFPLGLVSFFLSNVTVHLISADGINLSSARFNTMKLVYHIMASRRLIIVSATIVAAMIVIGMSFITTNNAIAQMTGNMHQGGMIGTHHGMMNDDWMMGPRMMLGNQSMMREGMMMQMIRAEQNVTGSINLSSTIYNAIASQIKTSLSDAASTAEGAVGNNSHAVAAHIGMTNGYLTYSVWVLGPDMNMNMVIVDPANGQILLNMPVSFQQSLVMGPGMMKHEMGMGIMDHDRGFMGPGMMW
jgi:hypothetical protein